jgi:T-complex protein 1 subunit theta
LDFVPQDRFAHEPKNKQTNMSAHKGMVKLGAGLPGMLKDGYQHFSGVEEAIMRNIDAATAISKKVRTSLGPNGMKKLVINHLEKIFVTSDAACILTELEVVHPAANILVMACRMQEHEVGDGTNLVCAFAGELLHQAGELIRTGLHVSEIVKGYQLAYEQFQKILVSQVIKTLDTEKNLEELTSTISSVIASKQFGNEGLIAPLIAKACLDSMGDQDTINVENIRVAKLIGGSLSDSELIKGVVILRSPMSTRKRVENAKIAVYANEIAAAATEAKSTVLIKDAKDLLTYSKSEEAAIETAIRDIAEAGINMIIAGGKVSEMAGHFLEKYNIMCVRITSKFELRRICRATGAAAQLKLVPPSPEATGHCSLIYEKEFGSKHCVVMEQTDAESQIATIVLRGSTMNSLDDLERAIDDGVNAVKSLTSDKRLLAGAGAVEIECAQQLAAHALTTPGLEQYAIKKFAEALEVVPRTLAENSGKLATDIISELYKAHSEGKKTIGVETAADSLTFDAEQRKIFDLYKTKRLAFELAMESALTILRVDQIIMAKRAGGPKPRGKNPHWDED